MAENDRVRELEDLRQRLEEAEETLRATRHGQVDALVVETPVGDRVYTLRTTDQPYRILVEQMQEGAVTLTPAGDFLYCNRHVSHLVTVPPEQTVAGGINRFIPENDRDVFQLLLRNGHGKYERCLQAADGTRLRVYLSLSTFVIDDAPTLALAVTDPRDQAARRGAPCPYPAGRIARSRTACTGRG